MGYRCVLRREPTEDAAACLCSCLWQRGKVVQYETAAQAVKDAGEDDPLSAALAVSAQLGQPARLIGQDGIELTEHTPLPAIIELNDGGKKRLVVLHRYTTRRAIVADPASGIRKVNSFDLRRKMSGRMLLFAAGDKQTGREAYPAVVETVTVSIATLMLSGCTIGAALLVRELLEKAAVMGAENTVVALGIALLLLCAFGCAAWALLRYTASAMAERLSGRMLSSCVLSMLDDPEQAQDACAALRTLRAFNAPRVMLSWLVLAPSAVLCSLGGLAALFFLSTGAALAVLAAQIVSAVCCVVAVRSARSAAADIDAMRLTALEGMLSVRRDSLRARFVPGSFDELTERAQELCSPCTHAFAPQVAALLRILPHVAAAFASAAVLLLCACSLLGGSMESGAVVAVVMLAACSLLPCVFLTDGAGGAAAAIDHCRADLCVAARECEAADPPSGSESVSFRSVEYGAKGHELLLDRLSTDIPAGGRLAITGSVNRRTALLRLLTGAAMPLRGEALMGGRPIHDMTREELAARITVLAAAPYLPDRRSIAEALRMSAPGGAADERAAQLCIRLGLSKQIDALPLKYETRCSAVTGEQRILLASACAMLADRPVLVIDRALDSLDTQTAKQIINAAAHTVILLTGRAELAALCPGVICLEPDAAPPAKGRDEDE